MSISHELDRLADLHARGVLSDDEFRRAKARLLDGTARPVQPAAAAVNGFRRSLNDRWLGGVCGGIAQLTGVAAWVWRLAFVLLFVCAGTGGVAYLLLWIFVPQETPAHAVPPASLPAH